MEGYILDLSQKYLLISAGAIAVALTLAWYIRRFYLGIFIRLIIVLALLIISSAVIFMATPYELSNEFIEANHEGPVQDIYTSLGDMGDTPPKYLDIIVTLLVSAAISVIWIPLFLFVSWKRVPKIKNTQA